MNTFTKNINRIDVLFLTVLFPFSLAIWFCLWCVCVCALVFVNDEVYFFGVSFCLSFAPASLTSLCNKFVDLSLFGYFIGLEYVCRIHIMKTLIYLLLLDCARWAGVGARSMCSSVAYSFDRHYLLSAFRPFFILFFCLLFIPRFYVSCIHLPLFNWWQLFLLKVINDASSWNPTETVSFFHLPSISLAVVQR